MIINLVNTFETALELKNAKKKLNGCHFSVQFLFARSALSSTSISLLSLITKAVKVKIFLQSFNSFLIFMSTFDGDMKLGVQL